MQKVKHLTIVLGRGCDMNCHHCQQHKTATDINTPISEAFLEWLRNWGKQCNDSDELCTVCYWGGEPLVYWNKVVQLTELLRAETHNIHFSIHTNGKSLTRSKLDFMEEHRFNIYLSYDLPKGDIARSEIISDEKVALFNSYKGRKLVHSVYAALTPSIVSIYETGKKLFPNIPITVGFIRDTGSTRKELLEFPEGKVKKDLDEFYEYCIVNKGDASCPEKMFNFDRRIEYLEGTKDTWREYTYTRCGDGRDKLSIDIEGNVFLCYNNGILASNILTKDIDAVCKEVITKRYETLPSKCKECDRVYKCCILCLTHKKTDDGSCITQCSFIKSLDDYLLELSKKFRKDVRNRDI